MWTRSELKAKGKASFKANYWKSVLIALVLSIAIGGSAFSSGVPRTLLQPAGADSDAESDIEYADPDFDEKEFDDIDADGDSIDIDEEGIDVDAGDGDSVHVGKDGIEVDAGDGDHVRVDNPFGDMPLGIFLAVASGVLLLVLAIVAIGFALDAFLLNPLEVGGRKFFLANLNRPAETRELGTAFDHNYLQGVKTMFLRDLFTVLWSLLFVIPGIVKYYEYYMIPYLIAENPQMDRETAFAESKRMMDGQKWNAFLLDLSFLGWDILSAMTFGILRLLYVGPYHAATSAALYEVLRYGNGGQPQTGLPQGTVPPAGYGQVPYGQPQYGQPYSQAPYGQPDPTDPTMGYAQPMPFAQQPVQYGQPYGQPDQPVPPMVYPQAQAEAQEPTQQQDPAKTDAPIPLPPVSEEPTPEQPSDDASDTPDDLLG
ncbi:MAG: DUF975 family protein [Olegusella sp.]|jgi:hypothetical protein|nr:DUF975 family protein [Olegusella sp.]